jgi:hypothetical protein
MPSWWDRFGQEWANQGLVDDPTFAQADAGWAFIGQAPPTVEQFNSMFQWNDDKDNWLYGQIANCIIGAGLTPDSNDLTQLWAAIQSLQRVKLDQDTAFYVDAINGNDVTGDGTVNNPFKTIQQTIHFIYTFIDMAGRSAIIQLAPGNYGQFSHWQAVNGSLVVQGDPLNPRSYLITSSDNTVACTAGAIMVLKGVSMEAHGSGTPGPYVSAGCCIFMDRASVIIYDALAFGVSSGMHVYSGIAGELWPLNGLSTTYSIYGGAKNHFASNASGYLVNEALTVTITGNPTFSDCFYSCGLGGFIDAANTNYIGTATGKKYYAATSGFLYTAGHLTSVPGTVAGTVDASTYGVAI